VKWKGVSCGSSKKPGARRLAERPSTHVGPRFLRGAPALPLLALIH
jgi:hypothetical protein